MKITEIIPHEISTKAKALLTKDITKKLLCLLALLSITLLSIFGAAKAATSPEAYTSTIESIDEKKATVMGVTASAATVSTILAAIPGDATTPIANQIMDISSNLFIVVCVLVLEKSLLTVMGYLAFNILIPVACGILGLYTFLPKRALKVLAIKFIIFALVIVTVIPFSFEISNMIYEVNRATITQVSDDINSDIIEDEEEKSWLEKMLDKVKDGVSNANEKAKQILNSFIDAVAIFIITYCAIPIVIVLLVLWFVKFLFGITIPLPKKDKFNIFKKPMIVNQTNEISEVE